MKQLNNHNVMYIVNNLSASTVLWLVNIAGHILLNSLLWPAKFKQLDQSKKL